MLTFLAFYIGLCLLVFIFQRKIQYFPSKILHSTQHYRLYGFEDLTITTADSVKIGVWFSAPKNNGKILLYLHGNGGNLQDRAYKFGLFANNSDFGVLAVSYRGYGNSEGSPSEDGLLKDAQAATDFLISRGYSNQDVILYGESLGSGVALKHAVDFKPYAIILEAPFYSIASVAKRSYWFLPVNLLLKDRFDSYKYAPQIKAPILVFHGTKDPVVPFENGKMLYDKFTSQKRFISIEGAGHLYFNDQLLLDEIKKFVSEIN
ncbi:MAG: alpha/beta fold hydrolase [Proteobacteria bacterium]|nr:alpha/beta fold hydrolase [Pseudomonadota bacterium]